MKAIFMRELKSSVLTVKSLIVLLFFLLITYWISKYSSTITQLSGGKESLISVVYASLETFGVFFGFLVFSGTIAKMVENDSIRYVIAYTSRTKAILAKYMAMNIYFILLLCVMTPVVMIVRGNFIFPLPELAQAIIFFSYITSIILMVSVVSKRERTANFIGVLLGFLIPIFGLYTVLSKNVIFQVISWLLPYRYSVFGIESLILLLLSVLILFVSLKFFENMEL